MKRTIVQIAANQYQVMALADDGSAWVMESAAKAPTWKRLPSLPKDD